MAATDAYRRSQEPLTDFIAECCRLGPDLSIPASVLRQEYESWTQSVGLKHLLSGRAWGEALRALGCTDHRTGSARRWHGVDLALTDSAIPTREPGEDAPKLFGDCS